MEDNTSSLVKNAVTLPSSNQPSVSTPITFVPLGALSLRSILQNCSNAFVGVVKELFDMRSWKGSSVLDIFEKEQRYMYIALIVLVIFIVGNTITTLDL